MLYKRYISVRGEKITPAQQKHIKSKHRDIKGNGKQHVVVPVIFHGLVILQVVLKINSGSLKPQR